MSVQGGTEKEYVLLVGLIRLLGTGAGRSGHRHNKSYVTYNPLSSPIRLHRTLGTRRWLIHLENLCHQYAFTAVVLFPVKGHPPLTSAPFWAIWILSGCAHVASRWWQRCRIRPWFKPDIKFWTETSSGFNKFISHSPRSAVGVMVHRWIYTGNNAFRRNYQEM